MEPNAYPTMTLAVAEAALQEFISERAPALQRLEEQVGSRVTLDRSSASLTPLWLWLREHMSDRDGPLDESSQPTWSRYGAGSIEVLSVESLNLVDGLISYVAEVVQARFPEVRWVLDSDPHPRYLDQNQPALEHGTWRMAIAERIANVCRNTSTDHPQDTRLPDLVGRWIAKLEEAQAEPLIERPDIQDEEEQLFEVDDLRTDGVRHRPQDPDFEIGLDDVLLGTYPRLLSKLRKALSKEPGVLEVYEEDREVLHVRAPDWDEQRLTAWLSTHLPNVD